MDRENTRQTDFSFGELVRMMKNPLERTCFYVNEVGCIMMIGKKNATRAEAFLRGLLDSILESERGVALSFLMTAKKVSIKTERKVAVFKGKPANQELIRLMEERLSSRGHTMYR